MVPSIAPTSTKTTKSSRGVPPPTILAMSATIIAALTMMSRDGGTCMNSLSYTSVARMMIMMGTEIMTSVISPNTAPATKIARLTTKSAA